MKQDTKLLLGTAKVDITPLKPVPLAGFAHRSGNFTWVADKIYAKLWYFRSVSESGKIVDAMLIQGDLLYWGPSCVNIMTSAISSEYGISPDAIIFHGSHSHSGPQTDTRIMPSGASTNADYLNWMMKQVLEGAEKAEKNLEEVNISREYGICDIGINRRGMVDGEIQMVPNPEGTKDPEVTVLKYTTLTDEIKGVMVHYTCHATTMDINMVSSEYCGLAMEKVTNRLGNGALVSFLQGCCGDIRPALIKDGKFYRGDHSDVKIYAEKLTQTVMDILEKPMLPIEESRLTAIKKTVMLPLDNVPTVEDINKMQPDKDYLVEWKNILLMNPDLLKSYVPITLTFLRISEELSFLGLGAEAVVHYGNFIKELTDRKTLPLGYTNGMVGYLPTAQQMSEGGYEAWDSHFYYGLPAAFDKKAQELVEDGVKEILLKLNHN